MKINWNEEKTQRANGSGKDKKCGKERRKKKKHRKNNQFAEIP